jgi:hypothetical protein
MSNSDVGPVRSCQMCGERSFSKVFHAPLLGGVNSEFPIRVPQLEKIAIYNEDRSMVRYEYHDVVFNNRAEQKEYLDRNNLCLTGDGRDPSIGASQHSHYDPYDPPAPSEDAVKMYKEAHFVEDPSTKFDIGDMGSPVNAEGAAIQ